MGIIARQSIKGTIATYIGVAVGFFTTFFVLTRLLTAEEIGLVRVLLDAATLFVGLAQLGTATSIIRFYPHFHSDKGEHGFFFWSLLVPLVGFVLFSALFLLCRTPVEHWFGEKSPLFVSYYYFVLPIAFFMLYEAVAETCANVRMRIVFPRAVREVGVRVGLLVCYLLYAYDVITMDGFVLALCLNYALAAVADFVYIAVATPLSLKPDMSFLRSHPDIVKQYILYTAFLIVSAVASVLAPTLSSFFVSAKMGLEYTGIFAIATYMAVMVSIPNRSLTSIAAPQLSAALQKNNLDEANALLQKVTTNAMLIGSIIFLAIWTNIDLIYALLPNGGTYAAARNAVFLLGLSQLCLASFTFSLSSLNYSRFYALSLLFSLVLTVSSILLNNSLIPAYGITGAALSNLLSYALYFALILLAVCCLQKAMPLCRQQLYILLLLVLSVAVNEIICRSLPDSFVLGVVRSGVVLLGFMLLSYLLRLSEDINALLRSFFVSRH